MTAEHLAARPSWDCARCGRPWPCASAKVDLAAEYTGRPTGLVLYLAACLGEATEALVPGSATHAVLHERFLGWTRTAAGPRPSAEQG